MRYFTFILISLFLTIPTALADDALTCPQATGNPAPTLQFIDDTSEDSNIEAFPEQILNYLNVTRTSEGLQEAINHAVPEDDTPGWLKSNILEADLTGDTVQDLLVEYTVSYGGGFNTTLSLYTCQEGEFVHLDNWASGGWMNGEDESPTRIIYSVDLNNNQWRDIVIRMNTIEGMKYHEKIYILEWDGTKLASIFELGPMYGSYRDVSIVNLDNDPATLELNIGYYYAYEEETAMAFIEYSYVRPIIMAYHWEGKSLALTCRYFDDEPKQRLAIFHSAETLRACGYYKQAAGYYQQLWNTWDDSLLNWGGEPSIEASTYVSGLSEDEQADSVDIEAVYYRAFVGYRLIQISLLNDEAWRAEDYIARLQNDYHKGEHGYVYAAMAFALWDNYQETGDLQEACHAAENAFNLAYENGDNPRIDYYEDVYSDGTTFQYGFYFANGRHYGANPDNLFAVPEDIDGMVSTPICL